MTFLSDMQQGLEDTRVRLALRENRCPDCGNWGLLTGLRQDVTREVFCCNPGCRSGFAVVQQSGVGNLTFARLDRAGDHFYPPRVHVLRHGFPFCRFSFSLPGNWPIGHCWVGIEEAADATCPLCRRLATLKR
jgi:hypothetical protein